MNEYKKKLAAMQAGQQNSKSPVQEKMTNGIPNSALLSVFEGKTHATGEMMGHKQNLAPSIAAKMSQAFGIDLTGMQVYRSDAMVGTGMHGMAQGNKVVLSSDVDLNTTEGQAVLGHELSHINAQRQGIGTGHSGLYDNAALEHQADVEGMRAAHGRPIYSSGMEYSDGMKYGLGMRGVEGLAPMSSGLGAAAAAPMQADKSFGPEAARKKLNARLTEQLAAYGMKVVDEDVSKPQNAASKMPKGQGASLPFSTPFSTSNGMSMLDTGAGKAKSRYYKGYKPKGPSELFWGAPDDRLSSRRMKHTPDGSTAGKNMPTMFRDDVSTRMFENINFVTPEQMLMGQGKTTPGNTQTPLIDDDDLDLPTQEEVDKYAITTPGDSAVKKKPVFEDINRIIPPKEVVNINQNLPVQVPKVNNPMPSGSDVDDDDFSLFGKEMASVIGNAPIKKEIPFFLPNIANDNDFSLFRDEKPVPVNINQNIPMQNPKSNSKTKPVKPAKIVDINQNELARIPKVSKTKPVESKEKKKKKPVFIDINKL